MSSFSISLAVLPALLQGHFLAVCESGIRGEHSGSKGAQSCHQMFRGKGLPNLPRVLPRSTSVCVHALYLHLGDWMQMSITETAHRQLTRSDNTETWSDSAREGPFSSAPVYFIHFFFKFKIKKAVRVHQTSLFKSYEH